MRCQCERLKDYDITCRLCARVFPTAQAVPHCFPPSRSSPEGQTQFTPRLLAPELERAFAQGWGYLY